ncbi:hypothetical protein GLV94_01995 [Virgibacillus halodenitrificans]|uniref:hypothetical protein n=1 Tax=Virgibacillus halodenitrificans TaxID=1482 RepID=UPI00136B47E9|nr:hypothetical protein [Virgibacillus halodenitrificans]MYL44406.1 hypothetical protein [Virgibacillus halodenitrificans]
MEIEQTFNLTTIIINLLLLFVTIGTVLFAKRNIQAIDSPRLVVINVRDKLSRKEREQHLIRVNVKNFGNGIALRTYLILITKNKQYYLSKPLVTLGNNDSGELSSEIEFRDEVKKAYVITQDFFNDYYKVKVDINFDNSHLHTLIKPIKRVAKYSISRWRINTWLRKCKKQGHTYPDFVQQHRDIEVKKLKESMEKVTNGNN